MATKIKGLQQWCRRMTDGYRDVSVMDFTKSWRDGLAFCALIHRFRPDLIDYDSLSKENVFENNHLAFTVAEKELDIPAFLEAADMVALKTPDKLSVITYVSQYYNVLGSLPQLGGPGVCKKTTSSASAGVKRHQKDEPLSEPEAKKQTHITKQTGVSSESKAKAKSLGDKCAICGNRVYLLERHIEDGQLYHRSCFRHSDLSPSNKVFTRSPFLSPSLHGNSPASVAAGDRTAEAGAKAHGVKKPAADDKGAGAGGGKLSEVQKFLFGDQDKPKDKPREESRFKSKFSDTGKSSLLTEKKERPSELKIPARTDGAVSKDKLSPTPKFDARAFEKHSVDFLSSEKETKEVKTPKRQLPLIFQATENVSKDSATDKSKKDSGEKSSLLTSASADNKSWLSKNRQETSVSPSRKAEESVNTNRKELHVKKPVSYSADKLSSKAVSKDKEEDVVSKSAASGDKPVSNQTDKRPLPVAKPRHVSSGRKVFEEKMDVSEPHKAEAPKPAESMAKSSHFPRPAPRSSTSHAESDAKEAKSPPVWRKAPPRPHSPPKSLSPDPSSPPPLPSSSPPPLPSSGPPSAALLPSPRLQPRSVSPSKAAGDRDRPEKKRFLPESSEPGRKASQLPHEGPPSSTSDSKDKVTSKFSANLKVNGSLSAAVPSRPPPPLVSGSGTSSKTGNLWSTKDEVSGASSSGTSSKTGNLWSTKDGVSGSGSSSKTGNLWGAKDGVSGTGSSSKTGNLWGAKDGVSGVSGSGSSSKTGNLWGAKDGVSGVSGSGSSSTTGNLWGAKDGVSGVSSSGTSSKTGNLWGAKDGVSGVSGSGTSSTTGNLWGAKDGVSGVSDSGTSSTTGNLWGNKDKVPGASGGSVPVSSSSASISIVSSRRREEPMDVDTAVSKARAQYGEEPMAVMVVPASDEGQQEQTTLTGLLKSLAHVRSTATPTTTTTAATTTVASLSTPAAVTQAGSGTPKAAISSSKDAPSSSFVSSKVSRLLGKDSDSKATPDTVAHPRTKHQPVSGGTSKSILLSDRPMAEISISENKVDDAKTVIPSRLLDSHKAVSKADKSAGDALKVTLSAANKKDDSSSKPKTSILSNFELKQKNEKSSEHVPFWKTKKGIHDDSQTVASTTTPKAVPRKDDLVDSNSRKPELDAPQQRERAKSFSDVLSTKTLSVPKQKAVTPDFLEPPPFTQVKLRDSSNSTLERKERSKSMATVLDGASDTKSEWQLEAERRMAALREVGFVDPETKKSLGDIPSEVEKKSGLKEEAAEINKLKKTSRLYGSREDLVAREEEKSKVSKSKDVQPQAVSAKSPKPDVVALSVKPLPTAAEKVAHGPGEKSRLNVNVKGLLKSEEQNQAPPVKPARPSLHKARQEESRVGRAAAETGDSRPGRGAAEDSEAATGRKTVIKVDDDTSVAPVSSPPHPATPARPPRKKISVDIAFDFNSCNSVELSPDKTETAPVAESTPSPSRVKLTPPARPPPPRRTSMSPGRLSAIELQQQLLDIDSKLSELELRGRHLEDSIRSVAAEEEDEVMVEWFQLVSEKNDLIRKENDLVYMSREQDLESEQSMIESQLHYILSKDECEKSFEEQQEEEYLIQRKLDIVNQRNSIVENIDEDRLRYEEEDRGIAEMLKGKGLAKDQSPSGSKDKGRELPSAGQEKRVGSSKFYA